MVVWLPGSDRNREDGSRGDGAALPVRRGIHIRGEAPLVHEAPIYAQLISERGDVPLQVRSEARRLQRELGWILESGPASARTAPGPASGPGPGSPAAPGSGSRSLPPASNGRFA